MLSMSKWEHIIRKKEPTPMTAQTSPLITFYKSGWENYQQALVKTIAPLTSEQLARPVAPHYVSIGGLLAHMIDARVSWFYGWMGEENAEMARWHEERSRNEQAVLEAASLVATFEKTWHAISSALSRWTSATWNRFFHHHPIFKKKSHHTHGSGLSGMSLNMRSIMEASFPWH